MIQITLRQKFYIAAALAGLIVLAAVMHSIRSQIEINRLEREAAAFTETAKASERKADAAQKNAERQSERAAYLEQQIQEIRAIADKQDDEIKKLNSDTNTARGRVDRTRRVRSIATTTAELCEKLESLGHGCGE
ncbi:MAG: hypothetical protein ABI791_10510 [Acidobacteriota bacterium]